MAGLVSFAPIYLNGLLALLCVFMLPGLVLARAFHIRNLPQRWFVVFLSSLTANHLFVTLIGAFHLDPLQSYRAAVAVLIVILLVATMWQRDEARRQADRGGSVVLLSDIYWLLLSFVLLCVTYVNVWKYGVPNVFESGDLTASWNPWSLTWAQGSIPATAYGYPQFVPTIWAITYIFTGSDVQYFAFCTYIVLIIAPIVLNAMNLGRQNWWQPLVPGLVFVWFIAEIRDPWLRATLPQGSPDWISAIFAFSGVVLFVANAPEGRFDRDKIVNALIALCLLSIAAATKPLYGVFTIAVLLGVCADAVKYLPPRERNRLMIAAIGLVSAFAAAYAVYYAHLVVRGMPSYPVSELSERLSRALHLLNRNFTLPFRLLVLAGLVLAPLLPRIRWLALPLLVGFGVWANTASYDLRNLLGFLLISAFVPLYALARAYAAKRPDLASAVLSQSRQWRIADVTVAGVLTMLCAGLTLSLAEGDQALKQRFTEDQLRKGNGIELNSEIEHLLVRGCTVFTADGFIYSISAFQPLRSRIHFFFFGLPLDDSLLKPLKEATGCTGIFYPPETTHPTILSFFRGYGESHGLKKVAEGRGMELLVSDPQTGSFMQSTAH